MSAVNGLHHGIIGLDGSRRLNAHDHQLTQAVVVALIAERTQGKVAVTGTTPAPVDGVHATGCIIAIDIEGVAVERVIGIAVAISAIDHGAACSQLILQHHTPVGITDEHVFTIGVKVQLGLILDTGIHIAKQVASP